MNTNEVINCVREHLDKWYASNNHNETAIQLVNEYEEKIRADERAKVIGEIRPLVDEAIRTMEVKYVYDITKVLAKYEKEQLC